MSATLKRTQVQESTDGRKIVIVVFTPQVPNPASQADIEVVFEVQRADAAHLDQDPIGLVGPLSCTRTDTREVHTLSKPQRKVVVDAALVAIAEEKS